MTPPRVLLVANPTAQSGRMRALLADTLRTFARNDGRMLAGATAFFALVSVAPMFLIALVLAGALTGEQRAHHELLRGVRLWVGSDAAMALGSMLDNVRRSHSGSEVTVLSVVVIAWGATRLFSHLQRALDHLWGVRLRHDAVLRRHAFGQARRRLVSFSLVLVCSVGLLASVVLRTAIVATGHLFGMTARLHWRIFDHVLSFGVVTLLFGLIFRVLPSVRIGWRQAAGPTTPRRSSSSARRSSRRGRATGATPCCPPTTPSRWARSGEPHPRCRAALSMNGEGFTKVLRFSTNSAGEREPSPFMERAARQRG
jgi:uncharacterized BrkB/YihY/UPF0761 family membrane protein